MKDEIQGFTLIEVLVALVIMGVALAASTSSFLTHMKANYSGELIFEGAQAAQSVIDDIRYSDIKNLPTSGSDSPRTVSVSDLRDFEVTVSYCEDSTYCTSNDVRQIVVRVARNGTQVYKTETVFTQLEKGTGSGSSGSGGGGGTPVPTPTSSGTATATATATPTATPTPTPTATPTPAPTPTATPTPRQDGRGRGRGGRCRSWRCW